LLDEIGDMPPSLQVKLLRCCGTRGARWSSQSIPVDVRVISPTAT
jgi:transcriptional regulator with PAS, ATPase and Fis domain